MIIASPKGCSDAFSTLALKARISFSLKPLIAITSVREGFPSVIVPVLSRTIESNLCAVSRASPLRIKIPFSAPFPTPTIKEIGVANPSAQGQAITKTVTKTMRA